jgi:3-hydroxyisobutyrate dehydrogenase
MLDQGEYMIRNVTLIGLGSMGVGIAPNLLKAGFELTVYNRTIAKSEALVSSGAHVATSPREAAQNADIVISIVADDIASREVWLGETGALASVASSTILIECSTLSYAWIRELASLANQRELSFLDAPVNGGPSVAAIGELKMMVGGNADVLERARPVLESFTSQINHMGPNGTGSMMKLVHNMMSAVQMVTLAEAMNMAEGASLNLEQVVSILTGSGPASPLVKRSAPLMASRSYGEPNFLLRHIRKDVAYAIRLAEELDVPLMTANAAREVYRMAGKLGYDDAEFSAVFEALHPEQRA